MVGTREIELHGKHSDGKVAIVDACDQEMVGRYRWYVGTTGYAMAIEKKNGKLQHIRMHHLIAGKPKGGLVIDHINRNKLDNRRSNLRIVTQQKNTQNSEKVINAKGYYLSKSKVSNVGKWVVDYGGVCNTFKSEDEAKNAVESIRNGHFVKRKQIVREYCQKCGNKKQIYGGVWACRNCTLLRQKKYYERKHYGTT